MAAPVVEYKIVSGTTISELAGRVNEFIKLGWEPFGSVAVVEEFSHATAIQTTVQLYQPMVRRDAS